MHINIMADVLENFRVYITWRYYNISRALFILMICSLSRSLRNYKYKEHFVFYSVFKYGVIHIKHFLLYLFGLKVMYVYRVQKKKVHLHFCC